MIISYMILNSNISLMTYLMYPVLNDELEQDVVLQKLIKKTTCLHAIAVVSTQSAAGISLLVVLANQMACSEQSENI